MSDDEPINTAYWEGQLAYARKLLEVAGPEDEKMLFLALFLSIKDNLAAIETSIDHLNGWRE